VRNLFSVRETLECLAVRQATPRFTQRDHEKLDAILRQQAAANELLTTSVTRAIKRLGQLNDDFHGLILKRANNEWLEQMLGSIGDLLVFARARLREAAPLERRLQSLKEHEQIAEALRSNDPTSAARVMSEHLRHLEELVINHMK